MYIPRSLRKKSNTEENQTLCSSINNHKYWVLDRVLHEWLLNKKESCKLSRSMHVNCQEKGRRKANCGYAAETLETLFQQNLLSTPITNFRCHDVLDSLH